ncbi:hypothetical protein BX666DRAFT_1535771 [Dichotomocladium elegans]|nr:hypothetical protein BX666DRAFT_1535771 [Dichotomocladium elegans]
MKSVLSRPEDKTYVAGKSFKVYSQDFQTVFSSDSRLTRYDECLVVDFGDGCPDMLSFQTVEQLNGGKLQELVAAVSVERSIALIQRGGRCDSWMSKINATMTFATQHHMNLRAFLFYDNRTFAGAQQLTMRNTTDNNYPIWTKPMPASRNASHMVDNDVRPMTTTTLTVPVYFGPSAFGISVKEAIVDAAAFQSASAIRRFVQLQPYFEETTFLIDQTNHSSKAEHYDGSSLGDSNFSTFGNQREYLAYVIAAVVIIVFGKHLQSGHLLLVLLHLWDGADSCQEVFIPLINSDPLFPILPKKPARS